jgi:hypothetical protein
VGVRLGAVVYPQGRTPPAHHPALTSLAALEPTATRAWRARDPAVMRRAPPRHQRWPRRHKPTPATAL